MCEPSQKRSEHEHKIADWSGISYSEKPELYVQSDSSRHQILA